MALIVVADDEFLLAAMLADILEDEGHETTLASHGHEALERIRTRRPALLITDFMMPIMTGLELAQAIKADQEISDIPIILVSGAQGDIARQHGDLFAEVLDGSVAKIVKLEHAWRRLDGRNDDGFQVAPFPG